MRIAPRYLVRAGFAAATVILGVVSAVSYRAVTALTESTRALAHAHDSAHSVDRLTGEVINLESTCRGYMLSGAPEFLELAESAAVKVREALERVRKTTAGYPDQEKWLAELDPLIERKIAFHLHAVAVRRERGLEAVLPMFASGTGRALMQQVRSIADSMERQEHARLADRTQVVQLYASKALAAFLAGTLVSLAILALVYLYLEREIRRRRRSESRLIHLNRLYGVLTHVSQAIVRLQNREELLQEVCRITVKEGGFRMAWVGLLDARTQCVNPAARAGHDEGYLDSVRICLDEGKPEGRGPTAKCIREGQHFVSGDIATDPLMGPWQAEALRRGYRSSAAFPIALGGRAIGAFSVYASEPGYFGPEIVQLLEKVATELAFALRNMEEQAQRRAAEEEVRRLAEALERRVAERTDELAAANRELNARNQEVEHANRLKSAFLARMSHELRTPLNAIVGFADLLSEGTAGALNEKQKRFVGHVQTGARHLLQVINDILDLSKIDAGRIELAHEEIAAADALAEVLAVIRPLAEIKRIAVATEVPREVHVLADRTRFKQILYNLLSNAVKFTPEGGGVRVEAVLEAGLVRFEVGDTGVGIPAGEHHAIFDEFHQVAATTRAIKEGTGLGLAITRRLVELQGGSIWVESQPGQGSRFFFTLPAAAQARGASQ